MSLFLRWKKNDTTKQANKHESEKKTIKSNKIKEKQKKQAD